MRPQMHVNGAHACVVLSPDEEHDKQSTSKIDAVARSSLTMTQTWWTEQKAFIHKQITQMQPCVIKASADTQRQAGVAADSEYACPAPPEMLMSTSVKDSMRPVGSDLMVVLAWRFLAMLNCSVLACVLRLFRPCFTMSSTSSWVRVRTYAVTTSHRLAVPCIQGTILACIPAAHLPLRACI